jgi:hypothetical protein
MADTEPKGCLSVILGLFGFRLAGPDAATEAQLPYRLRDDFLSRAEHSFYHVLRLAVNDQATICTKVNLGDIFFVSGTSESQKYRNKIDRKHVDFLLCHPHTMKPLLGLELDDKSHDRPDRIERDQFVDNVFRATGLPLLHIPARAAYDANSLALKLAPYLNPPQIAAPILAAIVDSGTPICPKCGIPMVQRIATKGENAGKQFWGCVNYPRCRGVA